MDRFQYLLLMAACLLLTLPLELVLGARVYRQPRRLVLVLIPVVLIFAVWDAIAIARGHWSYSRLYTTGWNLPFHVPVEEIAFFVAIPVCGLLTYEAVGRTIAAAGRRRARVRASAGAAHGVQR